MEITTTWETETIGRFGMSVLGAVAPINGSGLSIAGYLPVRPRFAGGAGAGADGTKVALVDVSQGVVYPRLEAPPV